MPSTTPLVSSSSLKKSVPNKHQRKCKQKSSCVDNSTSPQTESDDTEKSSLLLSNSEKQPQRQQRRRQYQKRSSTQNSPHIPVAMKTYSANSAVSYAGPDFMIDAPSPSSLPLPSNVRSKNSKQQQQHPDGPKPYMMDPISEIQEKLRMILNIQV